MAGADAPKVDAALSRPSMGAALYSDAGGVNTIVLSYGTWQAELPGRYPPSNWGEFTLLAYCPPGTDSAPAEMVSPLLTGVRQQDKMPQITAPPRSPSVTVHPGSRTGLESVMPVLGLEPTPTQDVIIQGYEEAEPAPPPPPAESATPTGPKSWWSRFNVPR
jgi:hypothetical protein